MKLKTKLTLLCALLIILISACLSGAMLWQVREQSYDALLMRSEQTMADLVSSFQSSVYQNVSDITLPQSEKALLTYYFRSCSVPGSVLAVNGEYLSAPTAIDPADYLDVHYGGSPQSAKVFHNGKHYLVLGRALDIRETLCKVYLVVDASDIYFELLQLVGRFAFLALIIGVLGLVLLWMLIFRTLQPLTELSGAAERIAAGNYSQRLPVNAADEVGLLADNFNQMAMAVETHVNALQEQNDRQNRFVGAVSHELKTPLTSLLLNIHTLQNVYLPDEKKEALLKSMDTQLHWLETMVKKLLSLISMKKNAVLSPTPVSVLLDQVHTLAGEICKKYSVSLKVVCNVDFLPVDKDLMCSALINLIENSAKASTPGQDILLHADNTGFTVTDQGRGISEQDIKRVTDPFYMGDPSRSKANGGFGLGLALVKEIAAVHQATLDIQSTPGVGTTVRMTFPPNGNETVILQ